MQSGDRLSFGPYVWRALDVREDRALLITESLIALRWYHDDFVETTWAACALRRYLDGPFLDTFSPEEREQILTVENENRDNPWFGTPGGQATLDKAFLLSLDEVCRYFGDSLEALAHKGSQTWRIDDAHNAARQARFDEAPHWWRLRSPGYYSRTSASVTSEGYVYVRGNGVYGRPRDGGGMRPALWMRVS